jgi:hypothetical protein
MTRKPNIRSEHGTQPTASSRVLQHLVPVTFAAVFAVSACSDATGPNSADDQVTAAASYDGAMLSSLVANESGRILPTLHRNSNRNDIAASLQRLSAALRARADGQARVALAQFNDAVARFDAANEGDADGAADLGALRLAVDAVRDVLEPAK